MTTAAAPSVPGQPLAGKQTALGRSTLLLQQQTMTCWSNGTMTETTTMETFLTIHHYRATNSFGGVAKSVQRARCTAGRLPQINELARGQEDALAVLARCFVSATLWKLFVLMLLPILTLKRTVSLLLK